jgi:hypothetical protein
MTTARPCIVILAVTAAAGACTARAELAPGQFAVGWPLELPAEQAFFDIPLTLDVYANAPSIEQIAVLDAAGEPMPFYRVRQEPPAASEHRVTLDVSPVYAESDEGVSADLRVTDRSGRTSVTVTQPAEASAITAFIVDARGVAMAPTAMELDWRTQQQPFLLDVLVEQSVTLADWRLVGRASVAALAIGGAEVRHGRVPLAARAGGYYRITWSGGVPQWLLERATVVTTAETRPARDVARLVPLAADAAPRGDAAAAGAAYFDAGGSLPVAAVALEFDGRDGWATADVAASASLDGPWQPLAYGELFYEVGMSGERLASAPVAVGRHEARYWRVNPASPLARERVTLRLEYPAEHLRFAAQGSPPYLLTAGTRAAEAGPDAAFAAVWSELGRREAPPRAILGMRRDLGGAAALAGPREVPWRTIALWAVLGGGVLAVAWMAVRLAREMRHEPS